MGAWLEHHACREEAADSERAEADRSSWSLAFWLALGILLAAGPWWLRLGLAVGYGLMLWSLQAGMLLATLRSGGEGHVWATCSHSDAQHAAGASSTSMVNQCSRLAASAPLQRCVMSQAVQRCVMSQAAATAHAYACSNAAHQHMGCM